MVNLFAEGSRMDMTYQQPGEVLPPARRAVLSVPDRRG
jgi:hypothetical protein